MKHFIIDGNNLIGKMKLLSRLQKKDKQGVREKLVPVLERYFYGKKILVTLHFDGFKGNPINTSILKIHYSGKKTADELIKEEIDNSSNPKNIVVVTSDHNLMEYARISSCGIISAENFAGTITSMQAEDEETKRIEELNPEDFKRLFGA